MSLTGVLTEDPDDAAKPSDALFPQGSMNVEFIKAPGLAEQILRALAASTETALTLAGLITARLGDHGRRTPR